ncbi:MAG: DinB family protein [Bacteroidota bacterium]
MERNLHNQLLDYVYYNSWANQQLMRALQHLTTPEFDKKVASSFPSVRLTVLHIWDAQEIWLSRLNGASPTAFPSKTFVGDKDEVLAALMKSTFDWVDFFHQPNLNVESHCLFKDTSGNEYSIRIADIGMHCINHGTYHRGQLITILRQLGVNLVPRTDYIWYLREKQATIVSEK